MSIVDRLTGWSAQRAAYALNAWKQASANIAPKDRRTLFSILADRDTTVADFLDEMTEDELRKFALRVSWIFAAIRIISDEVSTAKFQVKRRVEEEGRTSIRNHPFELLFHSPNEEMDGIFLLNYTVKWMQLAGGCYWWLAPQRGNMRNLVQIWPIRPDRVTPIPGEKRLVDKYIYRSAHGKLFELNPDFIAFIRYPHPFDLRRGLSPIGSASPTRVPASTDIGTSEWQRDTYLHGKGIPATVLSLDPHIGETDFDVISHRLKEDFASERKIAVTRGGDLTAVSVGIPQKDMELIASRSFTRDEIDTIFLGVPIHKFDTESGLRVARAMMKDMTVFPLHKLIASQITTQIINRFYGQELVGEFDDIRVQDRALKAQEQNVQWRVQTVDEARSELEMESFNDPPRLEGFGKLPVALATNPQFAAMYFGLFERSFQVSDVSVDEGGESGMNGSSPSLPESDTPQREGDREAQRALALNTELKRWRKVARRNLRRGIESYMFESDVIPVKMHGDIQNSLFGLTSEDDVSAAFAPFMELEPVKIE